MRCLSLAVVVAISGSAAADLTNPDIPTWRGSANTSYAQWDSFTSPDGGANAPTAGFGHSLYNFGDGAIIASSGNLYGLGGPLNIHVYPAGAPLFNAQTAVVNIAYLGNPIDVQGMQAYVGTQESGQYVSGTAELRNTSGGGGFGGATWAVTFDLSNVAFGFQGLSFFFDSGDLSSSSLDAISIDVLGQAVPAPGALALLGIAGFARRRRR